jgi:hypothetical protein
VARGRTRSAARPLLEFAATIVAVAAALGVAFMLDFSVFRFLLLAVTIVVAMK